MKRIFHCLLPVLALCPHSHADNSASGEDERILHCRYMPDLLKGDYKSWQKTDSVVVEGGGQSDNTITVKSCWDPDSLYFFFMVTDRSLWAHQSEKDHPELFLDDMVEVLIDADNDKSRYWKEDDIVYHINLLGAKKDDRGTADYRSDASWDGDARYTIRLYGTLNDGSDTDEGYSVEMAIPWAELALSPHGGLEIGVNFANGDNDGNGRQLYNWCKADPMRSPDVFGTLVLRK